MVKDRNAPFTTSIKAFVEPEPSLVFEERRSDRNARPFLFEKSKQRQTRLIQMQPQQRETSGEGIYVSTDLQHKAEVVQT